MNPKREFGSDKVGPKPVTPALGAAAYFLNGHTSVGPIEYLGETAWGYAYQRKDGFVTLALWDYSGNPYKVEIPVGRDEITLGDMMGNTRKVKTNGGNLKVTLTKAPVYIIDADAEIWGREAVKTICPALTKLDGIAGEKLFVTGKIDASKQKINGVLRLSGNRKMNLKPIEQNIFVKAGNVAPFALSPVLPLTLAPGEISDEAGIICER